MEWLGEDGIVLDGPPHSPMQMLMIHWVGSEEGRFFCHFADYPEFVEELAQAVSKSREPLYEIAAKSPAPVSLCGDNIDGVLVNLALVTKYFMPEYEKQARPLHRHGKLMAVHMDGRVADLKHLIAKTPVDGVGHCEWVIGHEIRIVHKSFANEPGQDSDSDIQGVVLESRWGAMARILP